MTEQVNESGNAKSSEVDSTQNSGAALPTEDPNAFMYKRYVSSGGFGAKPETEQDLAPRIPSMRALVRRFFPADKSASILDLGCGNGVLLLVAKREGYREVIGVDGSAEQVAIAHSLGINEVRKDEIFPFLAQQPAQHFDVIVTFDVIEHLTKASVLTLMKEISRVLKPGGRWLIHAPNAESPFFGRIRYGDFTHETAFTRQSLTAVLRAGGFVDIQCVEDQPTPHGVKSAVRYVLWRVIRSFLRFYIAVETGETAAGIFSQNFLTVAGKPKVSVR